MGEQCGDLALQCSDVAGFVNQVNCRIEGEHQRLERLRQNVSELADLQRGSSEAASEIRYVAHRATNLIEESHRSVISALHEIAGLIDDVVHMGSQLEEFAAAIEQVGSISGNLQMIARHTGMLAINASIEAARAGEGAAGFAAVAAEVKRLAANAGTATASVTEKVSRLEAKARSVIHDLRAGAERGQAARSRASDITAALESIASMVSQFDTRTAEIERRGRDVTGHVNNLDEGLGSVTAAASQNVIELNQARSRLDDLETAANSMLDRVGHSGVVTRDTPFIEQALTGAREIQTVINRALADGRLAPSALFDTRYQPIAGSDPQQYMTGFVPFADAEIRPLLDRQSANSNSVVGCCLIDRNGFLPTHITERSHPQRPGERLWNLENSRNRQIFMDRQTRQALDNESDWFLYTYRQDFGDGRYRALRSVLVPLVFAQQRWGLYEVGYLL